MQIEQKKEGKRERIRERERGRERERSVDGLVYLSLIYLTAEKKIMNQI